MVETKIPSSAVSAAIVKSVLSGLIVRNDPAAPNTRLKIYAGAQVGSDDGADVISVTSDITINSAASGANGLDSGSVAANTWYGIYVIFAPSTELVAGLISTSLSSPTMPATYTVKRLVGAVRTDSSGHFRQFIQSGRDVQYAYEQVTVLSGGIASSWTEINASAALPESISDMVLLSLYVFDGSGDNILYYAPTPATGSSGGAIIMHNGEDSARAGGSCWMMLGYNGRFALRDNGALGTVSVYAHGFRLKL